jgi:hypothetical protein
MLIIFFRNYLDKIVHLCCLFHLQNRGLLDTLRKLKSSGGSGEIVVFNTLAIGHTKHPHEQRISSWPFKKKLRGSNRQDFVFIRPPGIAHGAFELRMDNVWFCKVLLLFQVESNTDVGLKRHSCAFVTVLEEYSGPRRPGKFEDYLFYLVHLLYLDCIAYLFVQDHLWNLDYIEYL